MANKGPVTSLRLAVLGLGRMGLQHAINITRYISKAELVAAADAYPPSLERAAGQLPSTVKFYKSYDEAIAASDIDAVVIATETALHVPLTIKAVEAGKHVMLEKPLSIEVNDARPLLPVIESHPEIKVMIGFPRRFDDSYQYAYHRISSGALGKTYLVTGFTNDGCDTSDFFLNYAKNSGGIFVDAGIHDIDCYRWLLDVNDTSNLKEPTKQVRRVYATGSIVRLPALADFGDVDSALAVIDFENGKSCSFHVSRTSPHGHDIYTEIYGTESKLHVNPLPSVNKVQIRDKWGVRNEVTQGFLERFGDAYVTEVRTFVDVVQRDLPIPVSAFDAFEASRIAAALTHSLRSGKPVFFDNNGDPILE